MIFFLLFVFFISCSSSQQKTVLSKDEQIDRQMNLLQSIRPLLKSDELTYMKCEKKGRIQVEKDKNVNSELWKYLGDLDLRELAIAKGANIMSLESSEFGNINRFFADVYFCTDAFEVKFVDIAGMCKESEQKIFSIKYDPDDLREIGEEILKTKIRYYAIANNYKSFHFRDIKYSYTHKEFQGSAFFFRCY